MRGIPHSTKIKEQCRKLRTQGYSLNELVNILELPKTTIQNWTANSIILSPQAKSRIQNRMRKGTRRGIQNAKLTKTKIISEPKVWTPVLAAIIGHFMFDGYQTSRREGYVYCSRNISQIQRMNNLVSKVFKLKAKLKYEGNGVIKTQFFSVILNRYITQKKQEILKILPTATTEIQRAFLKAFFDDEGCVTLKYNKRYIRGFQYSKRILKIVQILLLKFGIDGHINSTNTEITIGSKDNLIKFQKEIDFSPRIYINPSRKNGLWKNKIEKRTILKKAIHSY